MAASKAVSPTSAEIEKHLKAVAGKHPDLVALEKVTDSGEGRGIYAATVTDPSQADEDTQHALIIAGQHGNEERSRLIALRLIDWLVTDDGAETRAKQIVAVIPNVSPDATELDTKTRPDQLRPNMDHGPEGATTPEGQAVEIIAERMQPEVFVDMHSKGGSGCNFDMVLYPCTRPYTEDDNILHQIAAEMVSAGETSGIPHITHSLTWPGWGGMDPNEPSTTLYAYRRFKSIVLLTESTEHNRIAYPVEMSAAAGLERMKTLLSWGNRRHPKLRYPGYPCQLALGLFYLGQVAVGTTAAARRASRVGIWQNVDAFQKAQIKMPEHPDCKVIHLDYDGPALEAGLGVQLRTMGKRKLEAVTCDGRAMGPDETNGYYSFEDEITTFTVVAMTPFGPGAHEIVIDFEP